VCTIERCAERAEPQHQGNWCLQLALSSPASGSAGTSPALKQRQLTQPCPTWLWDRDGPRAVASPASPSLPGWEGHSSSFNPVKVNTCSGCLGWADRAGWWQRGQPLGVQRVPCEDWGQPHMQIQTCFSLPGATQEEEKGGPEGWMQEPGQHPPPRSGILTPWGPPNPPRHQNMTSPSPERGPQTCACPWGPPGGARLESGEAHDPPTMGFGPPIPTGQGKTLLPAEPRAAACGRPSLPAGWRCLLTPDPAWTGGSGDRGKVGTKQPLPQQSQCSPLCPAGNSQAVASPPTGSPSRNVIPTSTRAMLPMRKGHPMAIIMCHQAQAQGALEGTITRVLQILRDQWGKVSPGWGPSSWSLTQVPSRSHLWWPHQPPPRSRPRKITEAGGQEPVPCCRRCWVALGSSATTWNQCWDTGAGGY